METYMIHLCHDSQKIIGHLLSLLFQSCIGGWASSRAAKIGDVTI